MDLPHDWVVGLPYSKEASYSHGHKTVGWKYPQTSVGWYRKTFTLSEEDKGKHIRLIFDGIFFDCSSHEVNGCLGCNHCGMNGDCVQKDDFDIVRPHLIEADVIVLATPVYYFSFTSQLKKVIDRFYALNGKLTGKKSVLLATMANPSERVAYLAVAVYQSIANFLHWEDLGHILATRLWNPEDIRTTDYGRQAYEFGKNIK